MNFRVSEHSQDNASCTYNIFKQFGDESEGLRNQYNEIRQSDFMTKMRDIYAPDGDIKRPYHEIMDKMFFSVETKNELTLEEITGWDKFCDFFANIMKLIYKILGKDEYKSTLDEKNAQNASIQTQNKEINQYNKTVGKWTGFTTEYTSKIKNSDLKLS